MTSEKFGVMLRAVYLSTKETLYQQIEQIEPPMHAPSASAP
jgi:hypothetical protein